MPLNLKSVTQGLAFAAFATTTHADGKSLDIKNFACVHSELTEIISGGGYDAEIDYDQKDSATTWAINGESVAFFNVVARRYDLKDRYEITLGRDSSVNIHAVANYTPIGADHTHVEISNDGEKTSINASGDTVIVDQTIHGFKEMQRVAAKCLGYGAYIQSLR